MKLHANAAQPQAAGQAGWRSPPSRCGCGGSGWASAVASNLPSRRCATSANDLWLGALPRLRRWRNLLGNYT